MDYNSKLDTALHQLHNNVTKCGILWHDYKDWRYKCESYSLHTLKMDGSLCDFTYEGGVGECPIWFSPDDVEAIAVVCKGGDTE